MHVYFQTQTHCISAKHDIVLNIGSKMFEDSKWVRSHKSREKTKTKKKLKRTNNDLQNTTHIIQDNDWSLTSRNVFIFIGDSSPLSLLEVILSSMWYRACKKSLKIPKGQSEFIYRRRIDNRMFKRKSTKGQTTINKTYI